MSGTTELPGRGEAHALVVDLSSIARTHYEAIAGAAKRRGAEIKEVRFAKDVAVKIATWIGTERPDIAIVCADSEERTARHDEWEGYKAGRAARVTPGYHAERRAVVDVLRALRIPVLLDRGWEADDQIGTIVSKVRLSIPELKVIVVSKDHDLLALVDDATMLWDGKSDRGLGPDDVKKLYDVTPSMIPELLALAGDGDEAPGVDGIGIKRAAEILLRHGTLEQAIKFAKHGSGVAYRNLWTQRDQARLSLQLVTLRRWTPAALELEINDAMRGWSDEDAREACHLASDIGFKLPILRTDDKIVAPSDWRAAWNSVTAEEVAAFQARPASLVVDETADAKSDQPVDSGGAPAETASNELASNAGASVPRADDGPSWTPPHQRVVVVPDEEACLWKLPVWKWQIQHGLVVLLDTTDGDGILGRVDKSPYHPDHGRAHVQRVLVAVEVFSEDLAPIGTTSLWVESAAVRECVCGEMAEQFLRRLADLERGVVPISAPPGREAPRAPPAPTSPPAPPAPKEHAEQPKAPTPGRGKQLSFSW